MTKGLPVSLPTSVPLRPGLDDFLRLQWSALFGLGVLLTRDRDLAADLVQDVLAQMLPKWESIDNPKAYATVSIRNAARRRQRHLKPLPFVMTDTPSNSNSSIESAIDLGRALTHLNTSQYETVVLRYYSGLTDREIASMLQRSVGTVKSQIRRALAILTKELGP